MQFVTTNYITLTLPNRTISQNYYKNKKMNNPTLNLENWQMG